MPLPSDVRAAADADLRACRAMLRGGSRSFFFASLLLPPRVRDPAGALYAFCRLADDAIDDTLDDALDGAPAGTGRAAALARLKERLARAYAGRPLPIPADRALARVVVAHDIPRALPEALLEGFAWDAEGRRYATIDDLHAYAARVAGSVGVMMAVLMGARTPDQLARAGDLGVAMQLTNIARDVGEDARAGRLYLPLRWLEDAGIDPDAWLAAPVFDDPIGAVVRRVLDEADELYARAAAGIARLPLDCRPGIGAARLLYAEIGAEVARCGGDSVTRRAVVPAGRKLALLLRALVAAPLPGPRLTAAALPANRFLVDAAAIGAAPRPAPAGASWWDLDQRMAWLVDLFDRLERQQRAGM